MTEQQFCYWLQGFVETQETVRPSEQQWQIIKDHLQQVFVKKTPKRRPSLTDLTYAKPFIMDNDTFIPNNTIVC